MLVLAGLWAIGNALVAHTLFERAALLKIVEAYGLFPFLIFYLAPVIYTTERQRQMLLTALSVLGAYLGLTVLFEMAGPARAGVAQVHHGPQLRHPLRSWARAVRRRCRQRVRPLRVRAGVMRRGGDRWRAAPECGAGCVALLCFTGTLLTLERSVWTGAAVATVVTLSPSHA